MLVLWLVLNEIHKLNLQIMFSDRSTALRIFITLHRPSGDRGFSKLALIKNYLRSTLGQEKLDHLAIWSIQHKLLSKVCYLEATDKLVSSNKYKRFIISSVVLQNVQLMIWTRLFQIKVPGCFKRFFLSILILIMLLQYYTVFLERVIYLCGMFVIP